MKWFLSSKTLWIGIINLLAEMIKLPEFAALGIPDGTITLIQAALTFLLMFLRVVAPGYSSPALTLAKPK